MIIIIVFIFDNVNLFLIAWFISIKNKEGKAIQFKFALSVQNSHIKYTVAPKGVHRPQYCVLNFSSALCVDVKKNFRDKLKYF